MRVEIEDQALGEFADRCWRSGDAEDAGEDEGGGVRALAISVEGDVGIVEGFAHEDPPQTSSPETRPASPSSRRASPLTRLFSSTRRKKRRSTATEDGWAAILSCQKNNIYIYIEIHNKNNKILLLLL